MVEEELMTCNSCGATVYPEHLQSGRARRLAGKLLCPHCVHDAEAHAPPAPAGKHHAAAISTADEEELEPLPLVDMPEPSAPPAAAATASTAAPTKSTAVTGGASWSDARYTRALTPEAGVATRCRIFHAKLNDGAIAFMNDQINTWADSNAEIQIKFATSTIGIFEGKHSDPNLIVTVFY
ncbi:MAG TPA: hypothetical protein VGM03_05290 [Phycisphaerae bacterium]